MSDRPNDTTPEKIVCAGWKIPADTYQGEIGIGMPNDWCVSLSQNGTTIEASTKQLRVLAEKLYWLDELHRAKLHDALTVFRCTPQDHQVRLEQDEVP
jgi:hypothetical protein